MIFRTGIYIFFQWQCGRWYPVGRIPGRYEMVGKNKQKLKVPENRVVRIWPHDRVGDFVILGLVFGILGAKIFDNFENWDEFIQDPAGRFSPPVGLNFYGGLITAAIAICWYAYKKGVSVKHLVDAAARHS